MMVIRSKEESKILLRIRDSWENKIKNFKKKIFQPDKNGCMFWARGIDKDGYGVAKFTYKNEIYMRAHRIAYFIKFGSFDQNLLVCHRCDNPGCVNPKHLFLGTNSDNIKDLYSKGYINPFLGRKHTDATKKNLSDKAKKRKHSTETKQKLKIIANNQNRRPNGTFI